VRLPQDTGWTDAGEHRLCASSGRLAMAGRTDPGLDFTSSPVFTIDDEKQVWGVSCNGSSARTATSDQVRPQELRDWPTFERLAAEVAVESSAFHAFLLEVALLRLC
jgi:hypothetical protein